MCYYAQETYQKGIKFFYEGLDIQRKSYYSRDERYHARTLNSIGECWVYLKNYKKDEKYIKKAFNSRISLLQQDKNHSAIARSLDNLGWCLMLRHQYKRCRRENLNMLEYLAKCTEKTLQKGKCRHGKQINAFTSVSINTIQSTRTSIP